MFNSFNLKKLYKNRNLERGVDIPCFGSSSSQPEFVARKMGACDEDITVEMPGGEIVLQIDKNFNVLMKGPATKVGQMNLELECLN